MPRPARRQPHLVIAAGGTGGHMFPAQALAEVMVRRGWQVELFTDPRGARFAGGFPHTVALRKTASATFARGGALARLKVPFTLAAGTLSALGRMLRHRPDAVIGFGGYPSIPALAAAWLLRLPRLIHEQNGVPGRVNQIFARHVDAVACGMWPTELPRGAKAVHVGNPVRAAVLQRAGAPYIPPGDHPMSILVIGGSQGARILSDVVPDAIAMLPEQMLLNLRIAHQAREEDLARVRRSYLENGIDAEVRPFFEDLPRRMAEAQLVISRSGASSVADIAVIGRPSILVPLAAAIRNEQRANARMLVDADAAILIPESRLDPETLAVHVRAVLENPEAAVKMAHAAQAQGLPDAAARLAELVERIAARRTET